jgi:2'-5' RNA ligase
VHPLVRRRTRSEHHLWPTFSWRFRRATRRFQPAEPPCLRECHDHSMRLFIALTPPEEVIDALRTTTATLRQLAPEQDAQLRWTRPQQWHLTLVFLGEVADEVVGELTRRLTRAAARHPPLSLSLGGGGRFSNRVLWTGVRGDRDGLRKLAASAAAAARRCQLPVEDRPYWPHLTLARATGVLDLRPLVQRLATWQSPPWVAGELHLVRSRLGAAPDGSALHEPIARWLLEGKLARKVDVSAVVKRDGPRSC